MARFAGALDNLDLPTWDQIQALLPPALVFIGGLLLIRILATLIIRTVAKGVRDQYRLVLRKTIVYIGTGVLIVVTLNVAGVSIGALLGAAGVVGIAIGIASQASLSNIISGLFLLSERFYEVGDVVRVGEYTGVVYSVDLLSVKLRTFDNVLIRVPNQKLIESDLVNITRFPIRRMDFVINTPFEQSLAAGLEALRFVASTSDFVLEEPEPFVMFRGYSQNGIDLLLGIWFERANYVSARNEVSQRVQAVFAERRLKFEVNAVRMTESSPTQGLVRL